MFPGLASLVASSLVLCSLFGCKVYDPLYCDRSHPCTYEDRPFCDLEGIYPASEGIKRTCIPFPDSETTVDAGTSDARMGAGDDGGSFDARPSCPPRIAFVSERDDNLEIYATDPDGTNQVNLTQSPTSDSNPSWSPDGARITFMRDFRIWTMAADGSDARQLLFPPEEAILDAGPKWSPDGMSIAFVRFDGELTLLSVVDAAGGEPTTIAGEMAGGDFAWSPDGTALAFVSDQDGNREIYTVNRDGSGLTNRTDNAADDGTYLDGSPLWSPDGETIFFVSDRKGRHDLWAIEADGSNPRNLTNSTINVRMAAISPDGSRIIYVRGSTGSNLYAMNPDGTGQRSVTNDPEEDKEPSISPDGTSIAWSSYREGNFELYVAGIDGSNPVRLTSNQFTVDDASPTWRPCGR